MNEMKQVVQSYKTGELVVVDVLTPSSSPGLCVGPEPYGNPLMKIRGVFRIILKKGDIVQGGSGNGENC